jgi:hypothetical protein
VFQCRRIQVGLSKTRKCESGCQVLSSYSNPESPWWSQPRKDKSPIGTGFRPVINALLPLRAAAPWPCYGPLLSDYPNPLNLHRIGWVGAGIAYAVRRMGFALENRGIGGFIFCKGQRFISSPKRLLQLLSTTSFLSSEYAVLYPWG